MIVGYNEFKKEFENENIQMKNNRFNKTIQSFKFLQIFKDAKFDTIIIQKINESKVIVIDKYIKSNDLYIIICFERYLIIIDKYQQLIIQTLFSKSNEDKIYFVPELNESNNFVREIANFIENFQIKANSKYPNIKQFWRIVQPSISTFLLKKNYIQTNDDRIYDYITTLENESFVQPKNFQESEFIFLRNIASNETSKIYLSYHIESEKIFIIKTFYDKSFCLEKRELENYKLIHCPFLPKFYGNFENGENVSLVIEFINGHTFKDFHKQNLCFEQKILIIIEMFFIFKYLHKCGFIYRDLKPNNLILDQKNQIFLFDFDRMIKNNKDEVFSFTNDFSSPFVDPEINNEKCIPSYQNDIYSIGKMILFILNGNDQNFDVLKSTSDFICLKEISTKCLNKKLEERPTLNELLDFFVDYFSNISKSKNKANDINRLGFIEFLQCIRIDKIIDQSLLNGECSQKHKENIIYILKLAANINNLDAQYHLGFFYYVGKIVEKDINKSIHYFTKAADQNYAKAQNALGIIYFEGNYVQQDVNKSFHYLTLAANQNYTKAQSNLGFLYLNDKLATYDVNKALYYLNLAAEKNDLDAYRILTMIYYDGKHVRRDINKFIHYASLCASQNDPDVQYCFGSLYLKGRYVQKDINKGIYYLTLAVNQNHIHAQYALGILYLKGKYVQMDINKSIYYFTLAANQNHVEAQYILGLIYYEGKYIQKDINKSIYYSSLAANQNNSHALNIIANIYYEGNCVQRDIKKSIYYFTLSANLNNQHAQRMLGIIFYEGKYITRDINKSIYYLSLAADNNNDADAQNLLGIIYYDGNYIKRDINKSIHYLTLSANQNEVLAQFYLGFIYFHGLYLTKDINKSIHYFRLAADKKYPKAQFYLGFIYLFGMNIQKSFEKAIYYFTLSANNNDPDAQLHLGFFYLLGYPMHKNINKGIYYLYLSANQNVSEAQYILGVFYSTNNDVKRDINQAIFYYKNASSLNNQYSKNNLAIIFKNGIGTEKNIWYAIELFKEAIRLNDLASMYNLSHLYFYEEIENNDNLDEIIDLLIQSSTQFTPSIELLSIVLLKKYKNLTIQVIISEIEKHNKNHLNVKNDQLAQQINEFITKNNINNLSDYKYQYDKYKNIDFLYNYTSQIVETSSMMNDINQTKKDISIKKRNISKEFYKGFNA